MAYVADQNDPNMQQPNAAGMSQPPQAPQTSSGAGGASNTTAPGSPQGVSASPTATQAPPVQDLKAYLTANAPQAVGMGQNIAGNLNATAGKVAGDINQTQTDLGNQVAAQNIAPNQELVNKAAANPADFVKNQQNVTDFLAQENANYGGPANFEGTDQGQRLAKEVANAQSSVPDIKSSQGVQTLARSQETNPTLGMSNLDTLLLQETPEALAPISKALPQFGALSGKLSNAQASTNKAIQDAISNDQTAQSGVQNAFLTGPNAAVPAWQKALQGELSNAQKGATDYNTEVSRIIDEENGLQPSLADASAAIKAYNDASGTYNPSGIGLSSTSSLPGMNFDLSGLSLKPEALTNAPTLQDVATPQDYATEKALEQLLGSHFSNSPINQSTSDQAGTFKVPANPSLPIQESIKGLQGESDAAQKGFTNDGKLQYAGTPSNSIITNADLPPGFAVLPKISFGGKLPPGSLPTSSGDFVAVPPGSQLPIGVKPTAVVGQQGGIFQAGAHGNGSILPPSYYSNDPLNNATTQISALIKYLKGLS